MASAGVVNIRRDVDDKFYRYKMPVLVTKIEGRGNGIKTVLVNMSDVARALSRPPSYPAKYFGGELGALTSMDEPNDKYIVNGAHDNARLRDLLDGFIDKFVLCGSCKNPETDLFLTKNEDILRDCKACGAQTGVDMRHKLTTWIIRNPPKRTKKKKTAENAENAGEGKEGEEGGEGDEGSDDDAFTKRIKAEAAELPTAEQAAASGMAGLSLDDEGSDEGGDSPLEALTLWVEENKSKDSGAGLTPQTIMDKTAELGIEGKHKTVQTLVECLFTENIMAELKKYMPVFQKAIGPEDDKNQRNQKSLLGGLERLVGVNYPQLIPLVPKILMEFYQNDVLEEDLIVQWGTHVSKKYVNKDISKKVRKAAEPMLKWFEEAEDEESE
ncbi:hypothetical protein FS837_010106 [Tulasnella sp. UAMH 9824]|nr:hypothetical protein FS837_010106 [Tulasnella sp. UAMH 9824]